MNSDEKMEFVMDMTDLDDYVLTGTAGLINLFDIRAGKLVHSEKVHRLNIRRIILLPNNLFATCSEDKFVNIYKMPSFRPIRKLRCPGEVWALAYLKGAYLATGDFSNHVIVFNYETGKEKCRIQLNFPIVHLVNFPRNRLIVCLKHPVVLIIDWKHGGRILATLKGHVKTVNTTVLHQNQRVAITCSDDSTIKYFNLRNYECTKTLEGHIDGIFDVVIAQRGTKILSSSYDHTIRLWEYNSGKFLRSFEHHTEWVICLDYIGKVFPLHSNEDIKPKNTVNSPINDFNSYFVSGGNDRRVVLWNIYNENQTVIKPNFEYKHDRNEKVKSICYLGVKSVISRIQEFGSAGEKERFEFLRNEVFMNIQSLTREHQICLLEFDENDRNKDLYVFKSMIEQNKNKFSFEDLKSGEDDDDNSPPFKRKKKFYTKKQEKMFQNLSVDETSFLHVFFGNFEPRETEHSKILNLYLRLKRLKLHAYLFGLILKMENVDEKNLEELLMNCFDRLEFYDFKNFEFVPRIRSVLTLSVLNELKIRKSQLENEDLGMVISKHKIIPILDHEDFSQTLVVNHIQQFKEEKKKIRIYDNLVGFKKSSVYRNFREIYKEKLRYLYRTKIRTNLIVTCESKQFKVHKEVLLYRSNFFFHLVKFDLMKKSNDNININNNNNNKEELEGEEDEEEDDNEKNIQRIDVQILDLNSLTEYIKFLYFVRFSDEAIGEISIHTCFCLLAHFEMYFEEEFTQRTLLIVDRIINNNNDEYFSKHLLEHGHLLKHLPEEKQRQYLIRWSKIRQFSYQKILMAVTDLSISQRQILDQKDSYIKQLEEKINTIEGNNK